jgi:hypothetical protein
MLKNKWIVVFLIIVTSYGGYVHAAETPGYWLRFPNGGLKEGERIEAVNVIVACGEVLKVDHFPSDWIVRRFKFGSVVEIHAFAAEGVSMLKHMETLSDSVFIKVGESTCFDVKASLISSSPAAKRQIDLPRCRLELLPSGGYPPSVVRCIDDIKSMSAKDETLALQVDLEKNMIVVERLAIPDRVPLGNINFVLKKSFQIPIIDAREQGDDELIIMGSDYCEGIGTRITISLKRAYPNATIRIESSFEEAVLEFTPAVVPIEIIKR